MARVRQWQIGCISVRLVSSASQSHVCLGVLDSPLAQIASKRVIVRAGLNMSDSNENGNNESSIETHVFELGKRAQKSQETIIRAFSKIMVNTHDEIRLRILAALVLSGFFLIIGLFLLAILHIFAARFSPEADFMPIWIIYGMLCAVILCFVVCLPLFTRASKNLEMKVQESRMAKIADTKKLVTP